jgi:hypothetical protein
LAGVVLGCSLGIELETNGRIETDGWIAPDFVGLKKKV